MINDDRAAALRHAQALAVWIDSVGGYPCLRDDLADLINDLLRPCVTLKPTMSGPDQYAAPAGRFGLSVEELEAGLKRVAEVGMTAADLAESLKAGSR